MEKLKKRLDKILINANQQKPKINKVINNSQEDLQHQLKKKKKKKF